MTIRETYGPYYGARILDRYMPGWWKQIDLGMLQMHTPDSCIAGILFKNRSTEGRSGYGWFLSRTPDRDGWISGVLQSDRMGFDLSDYYDDWDTLEYIWKELILDRIKMQDVSC